MRKWQRVCLYEGTKALCDIPGGQFGHGTATASAPGCIAFTRDMSGALPFFVRIVEHVNCGEREEAETQLSEMQAWFERRVAAAWS